MCMKGIHCGAMDEGEMPTCSLCVGDHPRSPGFLCRRKVDERGRSDQREREISKASISRYMGRMYAPVVGKVVAGDVR